MSHFSPAQLERWDRRIREGACGGALPGLTPAAKPLRIAMLGWARLMLQGGEGSGLNLSVSELAAGLASMGHRVVYLRSGMDYSLRAGMRVKLAEVWRGVGCFDLINSPNLAPGNFNFRNVREQIESPAHTAMVVAWVKGVGADVVHAHSLEGFGLDLVAALRRAGVPVAITPHNYYALCPQVDLLRQEQRVCGDNEGGAACVGCLAHAPEPGAYRWWRKRYQTVERWLGPHTSAVVKDRLRLARDFTLRRLRSGRDEAPILAGGAPSPAPPEVLPAADADENARVLRKRALVVLNDYGRRRAAGVEALGAAAAVLCPSRFLMNVHAAHGVRDDVLRHVPLGQPHFDTLRAGAEGSPFYRARPWSPDAQRPLRLAYFGNCYPNKGLATLVRALARMPDALAAKIHCSIRASGEDRPFRAALAGKGHVSFQGPYEVSALAGVMREFDVCVFPNMGLENSPLVVLEALHAGKFVIASRLGGGTDWIEEGRNGMLFRAGDVDALIECIRAIVDGSVPLPAAAEIHACSRLRSYPAYVEDVSSILQGLASPRNSAE